YSARAAKSTTSSEQSPWCGGWSQIDWQLRDIGRLSPSHTYSLSNAVSLQPLRDLGRDLRWEVVSKHLGRGFIDGERGGCRLLNWKVRRPGALENSINVVACTPLVVPVTLSPGPES